jgi:UDP-2,3-diacylglucosamine pyrophosphatase LpxH
VINHIKITRIFYDCKKISNKKKKDKEKKKFNVKNNMKQNKNKFGHKSLQQHQKILIGHTHNLKTPVKISQ